MPTFAEPTPEPKIEKTSASSAGEPSSSRGYPSSGEQTQMQTQLLKQLVATVKDLQEEMQEMKMKEPEKPRKQAKESGTDKP